MTSNDGTTELALSYYQKYDTIFAVAEFIKKELITYLPQKKNSMRVFYNYFYPDIIEEKSLIGETFCDQYEGIRILTVARFAKQKGLDMAVNVCEKLIKDGYFIRWYVCGDGEDKEMIEQMVYEKNLQADFIFLGNKNNPYGYMRACDLYVQPSRFEGYCTTTNEAKALKKPIITTNVSGAQEQFVDNVSGWIVDISEVAIYEKIKEILEDKSCLKRIADNLKKNWNILQNDVCEILGEYGGENDSR